MKQQAPLHVLVCIATVALLTCRWALKSDGEWFGRHYLSSPGRNLPRAETHAKLAVQASVRHWNAQPDSTKYHVADQMPPSGRSCGCYAVWLNRTADDVCEEVYERAVQNKKPTVRLAIPTGWMDYQICAKEHPEGTFDCPASLCHYSLISFYDNPAPDYSKFDGLLHYSGEAIPPVPSRPETVPWFKTGFIWEEPDYDYVTDLAYTHRGYDVAFTYRLPSGLVEGESYFRTSLLEPPVELFTDFQPPPWKERRFNMASMISHCVPERAALVQEIAEYMQVDQYGGCNPTSQIDTILPECQTDLRWPQQRCVMSHYHFYLAFENSQSESYVTEKLWQPLVMGAIPIYWGAPNINDFLPDPDAIIRVSDFESIKDLTEYLTFLTTSETAYEKHMQWRRRPLPQHFLEEFDTAMARAPCKLCDLIATQKRDMSE